MIENTIAQRYARALLKVAKEQNQVELYQTHLTSFMETCESHPDLFVILCHQAFSQPRREAIVDEVAQKMGLPEHLKNFLKLLIRKKRIALLKRIHEVYESLAHDNLGKVVMTVESAVEFKPEYYQTLQQFFTQKTCKTIILKKVITADLLGGLRIFLKDQVYDYTLTTQLEKMQVAMLSS